MLATFSRILNPMLFKICFGQSVKSNFHYHHHINHIKHTKEIFSKNENLKQEKEKNVHEQMSTFYVLHSPKVKQHLDYKDHSVCHVKRYEIFLLLIALKNINSIIS